MKVLCVAEKPSIAKSISQILSNGKARMRAGKNKYCKNFDFQYKYNGQLCKFTMTSLLGHLMVLDFGPNHKKWCSCPPVSLFEAPVYKSVNPDFKDIVMNLQREVRDASILMIWTDCDREGENIGSEIVEICSKVNNRIRVLRARFSVVMTREIHIACQNPLSLDIRQVDAVDARTELDLRIGAAFTRFQTLQLSPQFLELNQKLISYGSCQFPTLGFIVDQFLKVENFVSEDFWKIEVCVNREDGVAKFNWKRVSLYDQLLCLVLYEMCVENSRAIVTSVKSKPTSKWKPLPLTTVELQKSGVRFLKITSDRIMTVAEGLYNRGFISYPRTETDQFESNFELMPLIEKQSNDTQWGEYAKRLTMGGFNFPRKGKNNDKAHPPIHPTAWVGDLAGDDQKVYEFIVRRFLASCSENAKGHETIVEINIADEIFTTKGLMIVARNYLEIYPYDRWSESTIPIFAENEQFIPDSIEMSEGQTSPPSLLTEADLIAIMDKNGIGTDATIHEHIKKVLDRGYAFKEENYFVPSTLGIALVEGYDGIDFNTSLSKPFLRREMEISMKKICEGTQTKDLVVSQGVGMYREVFLKSNDQCFKLIQALAKYFGHPPEEPEPDRFIRYDSEALVRDNRRDYANERDRNMPSSNLTLPEGMTIPPCHCGLLAVWRTVRKEGANQGRQFFCCSKSQDDNRCDFFQWVDTTFVVPSGASGSEPQGNHHSTGFGVALINNGLVDVTNTPNCSCGEPAILKAVRKEGPNTGRQFYVCPKSREQGCGFFQWNDELLSMPTSSEHMEDSTLLISGVNSGSRSMLTDYYKRSLASNISTSDLPSCDCTLLAALKTVSKDGPNKGKAFYTCMKTSGKCSFFQWLDVEGGDSSGNGDNSLPSTSGVCFSCNQVGHFAKDCPQLTPVTHKKATTTYSCFICNKRGHFAKNCPTKDKGNTSSKSTTRKTKRPSASRSNRGKKRR